MVLGVEETGRCRDPPTRYERGPARTVGLLTLLVLELQVLGAKDPPRGSDFLPSVGKRAAVVLGRWAARTRIPRGRHGERTAGPPLQATFFA